MIRTAFILAAGRGERMRPLTDSCPKPLLIVRGRALVEWHLHALAAAGVERVIINTAWLAEQFEARLGDGARYGVQILYSREGQALETAGALASARELIGSEPFWCVSGDIFTPDFQFGGEFVQRFMRTPERLAHLLMVPNPDFHPQGDYAISSDGLLSLEDPGKKTFGNIGLYRLGLVEGLAPQTKAKLAPYFNRGAEHALISASLYTGAWHNVGTPAQLEALQR